jgi:hypothetical protein
MLWKGNQRKSERSFGSKEKKEKKLKENELSGTKSKFSKMEKVDLGKVRSDPLYRLGQALKSVDTRDKKADNFI